MERKTILIFGISSFVGSNLAEYFRQRNYRVIGTYHDSKVTIPGILTLPCDILNKKQIQSISYTFRPQLTIYAAGLSSLVDCKKQAKLANALNTVGAINISTYSERYNSKFCLISSCFIFSGFEDSYRENDTPQPNTVFGRTMASSEFYIQKSCLNYLIFRSGALYGRSYNTNQLNFFEVLERNLTKNESTSCDTKVRMGFLDVYYLAQAIEEALVKKVRNRLFQVSSSDIASYYDFARAYTKVFNQSSSLISKGDWKFPYEVSSLDVNNEYDKFEYKLDTFNLEGSLGFKVPSIEQSLEFTKERLSSNTQNSRKVKKSSGISFI